MTMIMIRPSNIISKEQASQTNPMGEALQDLGIALLSETCKPAASMSLLQLLTPRLSLRTLVLEHEADQSYGRGTSRTSTAAWRTPSSKLRSSWPPSSRTRDAGACRKTEGSLGKVRRIDVASVRATSPPGREKFEDLPLSGRNSPLKHRSPLGSNPPISRFSSKL